MLRTLVISLLLSLAPAAAFAADPADTVTSLHAVLIDSMKNGPTLGCAGRTGKIGPAIDADFDLPFLAQRILRRQWKDLPEDQRKKFIDTFRELVIGTYAAQFSKHAGETFETRDTQALSDGSKLVHAKLTTGNGQTVNFDYVLHEVDGNWRVVNVIADGVSDLALRSSQYDRAFKAGGFDGLIKALDSQIKGNKTECARK